MIFPTKHINFSESYLGLGGFLLKLLNEPKTVDEIWNDFSRSFRKNQYPAYHSLDNVILSLNYLYLIGAIEVDDKGAIHHASIKT